MPKKTQQDFTYLDWLHFCKYHPLAKRIFKRYKKKLTKLKGVDFMTCQGEMFRKLGNAYREFKEQHKKSQRESRDRKLKDTAEKQERRARVGREVGKRRRVTSRMWLDKTKELGKKRF